MVDSAAAAGGNIAFTIRAATVNDVRRPSGGDDNGACVTHSVFGGAFTVHAKANSAHPAIALRPGSVGIEPAPGAGAE